MSLADIDFGSEQSLCNTFEYSETITCTISPGWAYYQKRIVNPPIYLATTKLLHHLFERGNDNKTLRTTGDRAWVLVKEEVASQYWFEQAIVTETRIKAFFSMTVHLNRHFIDTLTEEQEKEDPASALFLNVAEPGRGNT